MRQTTIETTARNPIIFETKIEEKTADKPEPVKWTQKEYYKMAERGFFEGKRTEFLEGEIIEMPTMR